MLVILLSDEFRLGCQLFLEQLYGALQSRDLLFHLRKTLVCPTCDQLSVNLRCATSFFP